MITPLRRNKFVLKRTFVLIIALIAAIYGCRKEIAKNSEATILNITDPKVAEAKSWYENAYPNRGTKGQALHTNGTAETDISQVVKPYWQQAERYERLGKEVIEIPVDSAAKFGLALKTHQFSL